MLRRAVRYRPRPRVAAAWANRPRPPHRMTSRVAMKCRVTPFCVTLTPIARWSPSNRTRLASTCVDREILARERRVQILETARRALAVARVDIVDAGTFELCAVEVVAAPVACLIAALQEHMADWMHGVFHRRNADWAVSAVIFGVAERMRFELAEIRQHSRNAPAGFPAAAQSSKSCGWPRT